MESTMNREEDQAEKALRPSSLESFLGQEDSKLMLQISIAAARDRGDVLDHVLLAGGPGLGKTTLAGIIANEMGGRIVVVNAPTIKTKGDLSGLLLQLQKGDILFLDEIHSLSPKVEEILYPAMEDGKLEVVSGEGAMAVPITLQLEPFTLIGATTREGMLTRPLRDRFGIKIQMQPYSAEELAHIVDGNAVKLGFPCVGPAALTLARRSRGTPRVANGLLRRARDFAHYRGKDHIDEEIIQTTCSFLGIDKVGLDRASQKYLNILVEKSCPVGLDTICALVGEAKDTVEDVIEPHLMRLGFIEKTGKGRVATAAGRRHLYSEH